MTPNEKKKQANKYIEEYIKHTTQFVRRIAQEQNTKKLTKRIAAHELIIKELAERLYERAAVILKQRNTLHDVPIVDEL